MTPDDRSAIEQTIQTYFDGLYEGNAEETPLAEAQV